MKKLLGRIPYIRYAYLYRKNCVQRPGHYYSPVVDLDDLAKRKDAIWQSGRSLPGIDLNTAEQQSFLALLKEYSGKFPFHEHEGNGYRYYLDNKTYPHADGLVLFSMLHHFRPKKIIEVGSGFSSALMLDTKDHFLKYAIELTFIDPNPADRLFGLLKENDYQDVTIIDDIVQNVGIDAFSRLGENDILFIDNSHVSKTGSDVNYLMTNILPQLNKGVIVHIHDIFYPFEYPEDWLFAHKLNWNEIYGVHQFLLFNQAFKIIFFSDYVQQTFAANLRQEVPMLYKGRPGSLWIQRV
ncbi:MAG: class I SAM-dependent methyltransferase [Chitinophagaceae bacterium]|nr:class I SAM-dependent methyltransferase [Chitinophagaceae bacterium]